MRNINEVIEEGFFTNVGIDIDKNVLATWNRITNSKNIYRNSKGRQLVICSGSVFDFDELLNIFSNNSSNITGIIVHKQVNPWTDTDIVFQFLDGDKIVIYPLFRLPDWDHRREDHNSKQISLKQLKEIID